MAVVSVEEVSGRAAFKRFFEFPYLQFREEPRWSAPLVGYERKRLDPHQPYFDRGDGEYFLARRGGTVAGRISAHVAAKGEEAGWFGFYDVVDDPAVAAALIAAARDWLRERGCTTMTGPASFTADEELGILVEGFEIAGTTGRPWHPPWYAAHLESAGLQPGDEHRTWRLPAEGTTSFTLAGGESPMVGRFADTRIVLPGIVAVPDLTPARNSAIALARLAKRKQWDGCTIVALDGDPAALVPQLQAAAGAAGYQWIVSPWTADPDAAPETVHARFTMPL